MAYLTASCPPAKPRRSLRSAIAARIALMRQRRALGRLDSRALEDIGLSRADAEREARRPVWDAPDGWLR
ncbi:DUF1127 domain-containing protein [Roseobacteraceae bacterium NS-SX3]